MAFSPKTPGVYIQEIPKFPPSIAAVETAIPAFIGYTQKIEHDGEVFVEFNDQDEITRIRPKRIRSLLEYETFFTSDDQQAVFEDAIEVIITETTDGQGNTTSVTARAEINQATGQSAHNMYQAMEAYFLNGGGPCWIFTVGTFTDDGVISHDRLLEALDWVKKEDEPTLIVFPEAWGIARIPVDPNDNPAGALANIRTVYDAALLQCEDLKDRFVIMDVPEISGNPFNDAVLFRDGAVSNDNLKYGGVYYPNLDTTFNFQYQPANVTVRHLVDGTVNPDVTSLDDLSAGSDQLSKAELAIDNLEYEMPPSAVMAGIYARVDDDRGVWKAPANVSVLGAIRPTVKVNDEDQENLNVDVVAGKSINALRSFAGRGILVWGARTLAGNDNEWRYVPVRRFFNMVEESTKKATERFVFEPNDANTWTRVRTMIENFLNTQWRAGALQGSTPEQAYFVRVGLNETMTQLDILEGRMNVEIGMAVVRPAEFIILKFSHKLPES